MMFGPPKMFLTEEQCDVLWRRIVAKKYVREFGRDYKFQDRCANIQARLDKTAQLRHYAAMGIHVTDPLEGTLIWMKRNFKEWNHGDQEGNSP